MKIVVIGAAVDWTKLVNKLRESGHEALAASPPQASTRSPAQESPKRSRAPVLSMSELAILRGQSRFGVLRTSGRNLLARKQPQASDIMSRSPSSEPTGRRQRLFPRQGRPRETDRGLRHPLYHHPLDQFLEFLGGIAAPVRRETSSGFRPACSSPSRQTMLLLWSLRWRSRRRATASSRSPARNERLQRNRRPLSAAVGDPREVVSDPEARYFGGRVEEHSLVPLGEARLGRIGFEDWLRRSLPQK